MKIGYRRVSTLDQNLDRQDLGSLDKTFEEKLSGATAKDHPEIQNMMEFAREGDEIIVWSIDRMARDLRDLQDIIQRLNDKGVSVSFLKEKLTFSGDANDAFARRQLQMMGTFAEFERNIIRQRQAEGIARAKVRGVYKGRKKTIDTNRIRKMKAEGHSVMEISKIIGVSRMTVYRSTR